MKKKIMVPAKNHVTEMTFGDATHVLNFSEVDGHLEAVTEDAYIIDSVSDIAIVTDVE